MLYALDVAQRLHRMESGLQRLDPVAYRLFARRLRQALAGCDLADLPPLAGQPQALRDALQDREFLEQGYFSRHLWVADEAARWIERCRG